MARAITRRRTVVRDDEGDNVDYADDYASPQTVMARVVWFIAGVILALLGVRFILSLLGANTTNGFANFIYSASHPFVAPFFNLFHYNSIQYGVSRFEVYTLVAMLIYALVAAGIAYLLTINRRYA